MPWRRVDTTPEQLGEFEEAIFFELEERRGAGGVADALLRPARGALQECSLRAAASGALSGLGGLVRAPFSGGARFFAKLKAGLLASARGEGVSPEQRQS